MFVCALTKSRERNDEKVLIIVIDENGLTGAEK